MDNEASPRQFTLLDVIVLIGALAIGMAVCRDTLSRFLEKVHAGLFRRFRLDLLSCLILAAPIASLLTIALALLRLRRPRPPIRSLVDHPGAIACGMVTFIIGLRVVWAVPLMVFSSKATCFFVYRPWPSHRLASAWTPGVPLWPGFVYNSTALLVLGWNVELGLTVAASWLLLRLGGRWTAEANWIDRSGRLMGAFWIAMLAVDLLFRLSIPIG